MKRFNKLLLTALAVLALTFGAAGVANLSGTKAYAAGTLYVNLNVGKDISLKITADIETATAATATFTWKGNDETGAEKTENYVDTVEGEKDASGAFVFTYKGVGAQYLGKEIAVTVKYDTEESTGNVYAEKTFSVKDVLIAYRNSSAVELGVSEAGFEALSDLSADILNYGAAAQAYTKVDADALVNDGITGGTVTDFTALEGDIPAKGELNWVMGVRFDYNLQPMAKFTSTAQNLTATINGEAAQLESAGENQYKIVYKDFSVLSFANEYVFEVFADGESVGSAACSLAALAKKYDLAILRTAYTYASSVAEYLNAKKTLVIEAESDYVVSKKASGMSFNIGTSSDGNISYIASMNNNANASVIFGVDAEENCSATLKATLRMLPWPFPLKQYVGIEVNGTAFAHDKTLPKDENEEHDTPSKCDFAIVDFGTITLKKGFNTIKFIEIDNGASSQFPDFDKIEVIGEAALNEHVGVCPVCEKDVYGNGEDKCVCNYNVIEAESDCVTLTQAETIASGGVVKGSNENGGYVKAENGNAGSKITFNFSADKAGKALLRIYVAPKTFVYYFHNDYTIAVNGNVFSFESRKVDIDTGLVGSEWLARNYVCVVIGEIDLVEGANTIEFVQKGYAGTIMDKIELITASASITEADAA